MSRGGAQGSANLSSVDNLEIESARKGFDAADLLSALVKPGGSEIDLPMLLSPEFDLKSELSSGRANVLTKPDCAAFRDPRTVKNTSCFYNYSPKQFSGDCENLACAQPANDWCLVSWKGLTTLL